MEFVEYLKSVGPFTAPLCVAMTYALWQVSKYFDGELKREREDLRVALATITSLQERRAEDLAHGVLDYQEHATATQKTIDKFDEAVRALTSEIRRLRGAT